MDKVKGEVPNFEVVYCDEEEEDEEEPPISLEDTRTVTQHPKKYRQRIIIKQTDTMKNLRSTKKNPRKAAERSKQYQLRKKIKTTEAKISNLKNLISKRKTPTIVIGHQKNHKQWKKKEAESSALENLVDIRNKTKLTKNHKEYCQQEKNEKVETETANSNNILSIIKSEPSSSEECLLLENNGNNEAEMSNSGNILSIIKSDTASAEECLQFENNKNNESKMSVSDYILSKIKSETISVEHQQEECLQSVNNENNEAEISESNNILSIIKSEPSSVEECLQLENNESNEIEISEHDDFLRKIKSELPSAEECLQIENNESNEIETSDSDNFLSTIKIEATPEECQTQNHNTESQQKNETLPPTNLNVEVKTIIEFISNQIFNCQNSNSHSVALTKSVTQKASVLLLYETNVRNYELFHIPNFNCVVHFKKPENVRSGGMAIHQNPNDVANIITPNMDVIIRDTVDVSVKYGSVGEICIALCKKKNGTEIVMVFIYIQEDQEIEDITSFIHKALLEYTITNSLLLGTNFYKLPILITGDFNTNFGIKKSQSLRTFLKNEFNLELKLNSAEPITRYVTAYNYIFSRHLKKIDLQTYEFHFSYHKPIISLMLEYYS